MTLLLNLFKKSLVLVAIVIGFVAVGVVYYIEYQLPDINALNTVQLQVPLQVFTHDGKLIAYQPIDKEKMEQPEGICFSPEGKLFISSEGKNGDAADLFEFDPK